MASHGRAGLLAALWLATAVAAGFLGAWILRPLPEIRFLERPAGSASDAPAPPESRSPTTAGSGGRGPAAGAAGPTAEGAPPARERRGSWIEVSLADDSAASDGRWVEAYALPAGARGVDDLALVPHASFAADESGRIPIAVPGRYDVGLVGEGISALAREVEVEEGGTARVVLQRPRLEPATFRVEGPIPETEGLAVRVSVAPPDGSGFRAYPGRDDPPPGARVEEWRPAEPAVVLLPPDRDFAFQVSVLETRLVDGPRGPRRQALSSESILQPWHGTVRARETVTLRFAAAAGIRFLVRTEPAIPQGAVLELEVALAQGRETRRLGFAAGATDRRERGEFSHEWTGVPGPATVSWRPLPARPRRAAVLFPPGGPVEVVLEAGKVVEVPVDLRIDAGPALEALAARGPIRIRPRLPGGGALPDGEAALFTFRRDPDSGEADEWAHWTDAEEDGSLELNEEARGEWSEFLLLGPGGLVGEPAAIPDGDAIEVPLAPGGHLLVATELLPPPGGGRLAIRRADGKPIPRFGIGDQGRPEPLEFGTRLAVGPGSLLGPLPEGTHSFEVFLGGVRVGEASARVVAGRVGILRLPTR